MEWVRRAQMEKWRKWLLNSSALATSGNCDLSNNPLLGNPNIAGLTMCTKNGLYSAALLPITRSTTKLAKTTSVSENVVSATTQLGSSEMTTLAKTTNGTTMTDDSTTTEVTTDTPLGRTTGERPRPRLADLSFKQIDLINDPRPAK